VVFLERGFARSQAMSSQAMSQIAQPQSTPNVMPIGIDHHRFMDIASRPTLRRGSVCFHRFTPQPAISS
jgi:hypothetical protein